MSFDEQIDALPPLPDYTDIQVERTESGVRFALRPRGWQRMRGWLFGAGFALIIVGALILGLAAEKYDSALPSIELRKTWTGSSRPLRSCGTSRVMPSASAILPFSLGPSPTPTIETSTPSFATPSSSRSCSWGRSLWQALDYQSCREHWRARIAPA